MVTDRERLRILAGWHAEEAKRLAAIKHRSPWTEERDRQLCAHHEDAAQFLGGLASDLLMAEFLLGKRRGD